MKDKTNIEIINALTSAISIGNQKLINLYACELAKRLYVPETNMTFEELMEGFGYRKVERPNPNQITIEEYMRSRKKDD